MRSATLDASVVVALLADESGSAAARRALAEDVRHVVPLLLTHEVTSALARKVARGELPAAHAADLLRALPALPADRVDETPLAQAALALSLELGHPVYDCFYLAVAIAWDAPLVTADHTLHARAVQCGYGAHVRLAE